MLKVLGAFGLGLLFLAISPELRGSLMELIDAIANYLNDHSPVSYICVGVAGLIGAMIWIYRAAQPRC
jgi:hypothetical protein